MTQDEIDLTFFHFIAKHGKTYASKDKIIERIDIFKKNLIMIHEHNNGEQGEHY
jgi:hypothetical protein